MDYDKKCQLLIIGDAIVGKTSILSRFENNSFNPNYLATVGLDFFKKEVIIDNKKIRIKIWDTAGQERYKSLTKGFFRNAQGIIIVFDVTNKESFDNLQYWIQSILNNISDIGNIPVIIIGNKIDLPQREINKEDGENYAKKYNYKYFETSAKSGENIEESIMFLVREVLKLPTDKEKDNKTKNIKLKEDNIKDKISAKLENCCNKK